jgi:hypothetical protein
MFVDQGIKFKSEMMQGKDKNNDDGKKYKVMTRRTRSEEWTLYALRAEFEPNCPWCTGSSSRKDYQKKSDRQVPR